MKFSIYLNRRVFVMMHKMGCWVGWWGGGEGGRGGRGGEGGEGVGGLVVKESHVTPGEGIIIGERLNIHC